MLEQQVGVEAMPLLEIAGKCHDLRVVGKVGEGGRCLAKAGRCCQQQRGKGMFQFVLRQGSRAMAARSFVKSFGKGA